MHGVQCSSVPCAAVAACDPAAGAAAAVSASRQGLLAASWDCFGPSSQLCV